MEGPSPSPTLEKTSQMTHRVSQGSSQTTSSNYTANRSAQVSVTLSQRQPRGIQQGFPGTPQRTNPIQTFYPTMGDVLISLFLLMITTTICLLIYTYYGLYFSILSFLLLTKLGCLRFFAISLSCLAFLLGGYYCSRQELLRRCDARETPATEKKSMGGNYSGVSYGFSCMQGWRRSMEDDHTMVVEPCGEKGFFAIFDGHCGCAVASYCGKHLYSFIHKTDSFVAGDYPKAIRDGFHAIDKHILQTRPTERSGCTAVVLLVTEEKESGTKKLYCGNAGDSRCIVSREGNGVELSEDHKPTLLCERTRIEKAGCTVTNKRVNGCLALSRAIGDYSFKTNSSISWEEQAVTCDPEIRSLTVDPDKDEFAVLACDGIWDVMTNNRVISFVREGIQNNKPLATICEELMTACLSTSPFGIGCDNMSVIIVTFNQSQLLKNFSPPAIIPKVVEMKPKSKKSTFKKNKDGLASVTNGKKEQLSSKSSEDMDRTSKDVVENSNEEDDEPGEKEENVSLYESIEERKLETSSKELSTKEKPPPIFSNSSQREKERVNEEELDENDVSRSASKKIPIIFP